MELTLPKEILITNYQQKLFKEGSIETKTKK